MKTSNRLAIALRKMLAAFDIGQDAGPGSAIHYARDIMERHDRWMNRNRISPIPEKKILKEPSFWIVVNFKSHHWMMNETKQWDDKSLALEYAQDLTTRHPDKSYHVLESKYLIKTATPKPPIEIIEMGN